VIAVESTEYKLPAGEQSLIYKIVNKRKSRWADNRERLFPVPTPIPALAGWGGVAKVTRTELKFG